MNVSETKSEGLLREYQIVITAAEIDAEVTKKLEEIAKTVKMPGFRPGKVPMSVVKSRFGDQVRGDAIKAALDEGARHVVVLVTVAVVANQSSVYCQRHMLGLNRVESRSAGDPRDCLEGCQSLACVPRGESNELRTRLRAHLKGSRKSAWVSRCPVQEDPNVFIVQRTQGHHQRATEKG